MKKILTKVIMLVSFIGVLFSIWLISMDAKSPGFCPKIMFVPACYLVFIAFFLVFISTYILKVNKSNKVFLVGDTLGLALAVWFSLNQMYGIKECPTLFGIPLCYVSFFTFLLLTILYFNRRLLRK